MHGLGPQAHLVYTALRERIAHETCVPGSRLPPHKTIAREFGVALMTARQALSKLEEDGLIVSMQGRGTFVRSQASSDVLVVAQDRAARRLTCEHVTRAGYGAVEAESAQEGVRTLCTDPSIALILCDIRLPTVADGIAFVRTVRQRWPAIPRAAITASLQDLADLQDTPECPVLILAQSTHPGQIADLLQWTLKPSSLNGHDSPPRTNDDPTPAVSGPCRF